MAIAKINSYCRKGPGANYSYASGKLLEGEEVPIIGITKDGYWVLVLIEKYETKCWVSIGENGTVDSKGDMSEVPILKPPPTDTPTPTSTFTPSPTPEPTLVETEEEQA
jgi:hypothetical protein